MVDLGKRAVGLVDARFDHRPGTPDGGELVGEKAWFVGEPVIDGNLES
jgi:hypothetical protein